MIILMLSIMPACSQIVANNGISSPTEIPDRLSRKEVQNRYGSPVSSTATGSGKQVEIYRLRKRLDVVFSVMGDSKWVSRQNSPDSQAVNKSALICLLLGPGCLYILTAVTVNETFSLPVNLVRSQMTRLEVAFVFGNDDRLLYLYDAQAGPPVRFSQALHTIKHPLVRETDSDESATLTDLMKGYIAEARQRAEDIGHTFTEEDEESLRADLRTAEDVDAGIITKQEAVTTRPSRFVATYKP
jgi:hypothetical protein